MKKKMVTAGLALLVAVCAFAVPVMAEEPSCSIDKLAGDWAFQTTGKNGASDVIGTGTFRLNKDGTSSSHLWINIGGTTFLEFDRFGNTTMGENCTLTQTWDGGGPLAKCVILDDGNEMWCVYDQPAFSRVDLRRMHTRH